MFSKNEILDAIDDLESAPATYQNAEKLATFYLLYDHLYVEKEPVNRIEPVREVTISGQNAEDVWEVMNELMDTIKALQPKLYNATIDNLKQL